MREFGQRGVFFDSSGHKLLGTFFTGGRGPRPTVVVLHGMPGIEKNYDLMYELRRSGYNALLFHYRGTWGSQGAFSFAGTAADTIAALDHLTSDRYANEVDPAAIALVGHSMGGWAAVMSGGDRRVAAVCASAAVVEPSKIAFTEEAVGESFTPWLAGITTEGFLSSWRELPACLDAAAMLAKPLLVVHGATDEVIPLEQGRALFAAASEPKRLEIHPEADHAFIDERRWWVTTVMDWLRQILPEPR